MADEADKNDQLNEGEELEDEEQKEEMTFKHLDNDPKMKEEIIEVFDIFDKTKEQTIDLKSLATVLRWLKFNPTESQLKEYTNKYDTNESNLIKRDDLFKIVDDMMAQPDTIEELIAAMQLFDSDKDGKL